jgi:hypothetical protein
VKYINAKKLDPIIHRYIKILREKNISIPNELLVWEDLVKYKISPKKRTLFLKTNFNNLTKKAKRKYYSKGNHYFNHIRNKTKAKQYTREYKANISSSAQKVFYFFLKLRTLLHP